MEIVVASTITSFVHAYRVCDGIDQPCVTGNLNRNTNYFYAIFFIKFIISRNTMEKTNVFITIYT